MFIFLVTQNFLQENIQYYLLVWKIGAVKAVTLYGFESHRNLNSVSHGLYVKIGIFLVKIS